MKVLFLNTTDRGGGAANAAFRLCQGIKNCGMEAQMLVQTVTRGGGDVLGPETYKHKVLSFINPLIDTMPARLYRNRPLLNFSTGLLPDEVSKRIALLAPDLIHLHWVAQGFAGITAVPHFNRPLVWTLHDFWPFTGGCHYPGQCEKYLHSCGQCPALGSDTSYDLSKLIFRRKQACWRRLDLTLVAPSNWIGDCARRSSLFRDTPVEVIPNGLDLRVFKPVNRKIARELLNLPQEKKLILFGAKSTDDSRKGFGLLAQALQQLDNKLLKNSELMLFGAGEQSSLPGTTFRMKYVGTLHDEVSLAMLYAAVDAFVAPSLQENLANTVMEALACGTPCVAFNIGGMPDMVEHLRNGYLAKPFDAADLAAGIEYILNHPDSHELSGNARSKVVREYDINVVAQKHIDLYEHILKKGAE
jgi:glycosyltransferase involved in cell wall biosynthesis